MNNKRKKVRIGIVVSACILLGFLFLLVEGKKPFKKTELSVYDLEEESIQTDEESGKGYVDNILLAYFSEESSEKDKEFIVEHLNGEIAGRIDAINQLQIRIPSMTKEELENTCKETMEADCVEYCAYDTVYDSNIIDTIPKDQWDYFDASWDPSHFSRQNWGLMAIDAPKAWTLNQNNKGTVIGIVDSGIDIDHEDLKGRIDFPSREAEFFNTPSDHGTHIAGIIGAIANNQTGLTGMDWNSKIMAYDCFMDKEIVTGNDIIAGIATLVENGAKVINLSVGCSASALSNHFATIPEEDVDREAMDIAVPVSMMLASGYDFLLVQAAGNGAKDGIGVDAKYNGAFCAISSSNADNYFASSQDLIDHIIIVGNAEPFENGYRQEISSNGGDRVSIFAPGTYILSCVPNDLYAYMTGTSMAAPYVTASAAMVWSMNPEMSAIEVKRAICNPQNTKYAVLNNRDNASDGSGRLVNTYLAMQSVNSGE